LFWNGWNCEWEEDGVQWGKFKGKKVLMRKVITFLECYVQREFHHDNLLRWVFLLVDMNERERVWERLRKTLVLFNFYTHGWLHPPTHSLTFFLHQYYTFVWYISIHFILLNCLGILFTFSFFFTTFHHSLVFPLSLATNWLKCVYNSDI
jgi:hypothetical protein